MNPDEYPAMYAMEDRYWWFVARRSAAVAMLERFSRPGPVLDVGCGTGALLQVLQSRGSATGVDLSNDALRFCRERGLRIVVRANAEALPFADASFDQVVTLDTLEHVRSDSRALAEIARVLRPGGVVVLNVPAFRWLWGPHDVALHHQRRYTARRVREILGEAGLEVVWCSHSVFFLFPVVVMLRAVERLRPGPARVRLPRVPEWMNRALIQLMEWEAALARCIPLPWGSSVIAVARRPNA